MGWGADFWGERALLTSLVITAGVMPVFPYRHYVTDRGQFPPWMQIELVENGEPIRKRAGILPYVVLITGGLTIYAGHLLATYTP
jgi:hypothetical protein